MDIMKMAEAYEENAVFPPEEPTRKSFQSLPDTLPPSSKDPPVSSAKNLLSAVSTRIKQLPDHEVHHLYEMVRTEYERRVSEIKGGR